MRRLLPSKGSVGFDLEGKKHRANTQQENSRREFEFRNGQYVRKRINVVLVAHYTGHPARANAHVYNFRTSRLHGPCTAGSKPPLQATVPYRPIAQYNAPVQRARNGGHFALMPYKPERREYRHGEISRAEAEHTMYQGIPKLAHVCLLNNTIHFPLEHKRQVTDVRS